MSSNDLLQDPVDEHDAVLWKWISSGVLDVLVVLDEDCFHLHSQLESRMAILPVPDVNTLQDGLCNLSLHVVEAKVSTSFLVLGEVDVPIGLHGCGEGVNDGNGTLVLDGT